MNGILDAPTESVTMPGPRTTGDLCNWMRVEEGAPDEYRSHVRDNLKRRIAAQIGEIVTDGRAYVVQVEPVVESRVNDDALWNRMTFSNCATVVLRDWRDANVGEECIGDDAWPIMSEVHLPGERRFAHVRHPVFDIWRRVA